MIKATCFWVCSPQLTTITDARGRKWSPRAQRVQNNDHRTDISRIHQVC